MRAEAVLSTMIIGGILRHTCSRRINPVYPYDDQPTQPYRPVAPEPKRGRRLWALSAVLLLGFLGGGAAGGIVARATTPAPVQKTIYITKTSPGTSTSPVRAPNQPQPKTVDTSDRAVQV